MHDSGESDNPSVCHTINTTSPSICQTHDMSVCYTNIMTSLSICQSHHSSVCHTTNTTSPSICQSTQTSICHTIILTSPSVCQLHDSSVCQPKCDSTQNSIWKAVCPLSVLSILPSAKFMVKMPSSIPVQKFPITKYPGKILSVHTSSDSSVNPSGRLSITSSPSAQNPSKIPCNHGENNTVNYLQNIPVKSPSMHTLYAMLYVPLIHDHMFHPSVHHLLRLSLHLSVHCLYNLSVHHMLCLSLHPSMHCPSHLSIYHTLCLSLHLSMHCPFCPSSIQ